MLEFIPCETTLLELILSLSLVLLSSSLRCENSGEDLLIHGDPSTRPVVEVEIACLSHIALFKELRCKRDTLGFDTCDARSEADSDITSVIIDVRVSVGFTAVCELFTESTGGSPPSL